MPHGNNPFGNPGPTGPTGPATAPPPFAPGAAPGPGQQPYGNNPGFGPGPGQQAYGMPTPGCQFCGAQPAVETTIRGHRGYILAMSFRKSKAVFCANCGLAEYHRMQSETLKFGWWSPFSVVLGPLTMIYNLAVPKRKLDALAASGAGGTGAGGTGTPGMPHQGPRY